MKLDDGEAIEEEDGDRADKVNFGPCTHSFTPHHCGISLASHQTPIVGIREEGEISEKL